MFKKLSIASLLISTILTTGCSTVIKGTTDKITVNSLEPGTVIYVDGVKRGIDDALVEVERGDKHVIKVEKPGCEPLIVETNEKFDATSLLGIFLDFGIISIPVDLATGAAWKQSPSMYTVTPNCNITNSSETIETTETVTMVTNQ